MADGIQMTKIWLIFFLSTFTSVPFNTHLVADITFQHLTITQANDMAMPLTDTELYLVATQLG